MHYVNSPYVRTKDVIKWYRDLYKKHGGPAQLAAGRPQDSFDAAQGKHWTLWCKRPKTMREREQVMMEAILTQRANWRNVEQAVALLKKERLLSLAAYARAYCKNPVHTALLIKSSGFYQQKAQRLCGLAAFVKKRYGGIAAMKKAALPRLRTELLSLNGVGPETADSILLYAFDKPIFVIDEYTRRFLEQLKRSHQARDAYHALQQFFQANFKKDFRLYQDFHALIVIDQKNKKARGGGPAK
ncbi:MAG: endonuclease [Patescibacteria group bacterium]